MIAALLPVYRRSLVDVCVSIYAQHPVAIVFYLHALYRHRNATNMAFIVEGSPVKILAIKLGVEVNGTRVFREYTI